MSHECHGISNHQPLDCLFNSSCSLTTTKHWNSTLLALMRAMKQWLMDSPHKLPVMQKTYPDSKVHGANKGPTWVLSAPDGPHVGPMDLAIRVSMSWHHKIVSCDFQFLCSKCRWTGIFAPFPMVLIPIAHIRLIYSVCYLFIYLFVNCFARQLSNARKHIFHIF